MLCVCNLCDVLATDKRLGMAKLYDSTRDKHMGREQITKTAPVLLGSSCKDMLPFRNTSDSMSRDTLTSLSTRRQPPKGQDLYNSKWEEQVESNNTQSHLQVWKSEQYCGPLFPLYDLNAPWVPLCIVFLPDPIPHNSFTLHWAKMQFPGCQFSQSLLFLLSVVFVMPSFHFKVLSKNYSRFALLWCNVSRKKLNWGCNWAYSQKRTVQFDELRCEVSNQLNRHDTWQYLSVHGHQTEK